MTKRILMVFLVAMMALACSAGTADSTSDTEALLGVPGLDGTGGSTMVPTGGASTGGDLSGTGSGGGTTFPTACGVSIPGETDTCNACVTGACCAELAAELEGPTLATMTALAECMETSCGSGCATTAKVRGTVDELFGDSCENSHDKVCNDTSVWPNADGTCEAGSDAFDCLRVGYDESNNCLQAYNGVCDEGTGCIFGSDTYDCSLPPAGEECLHSLDGTCDEGEAGLWLCADGTDTTDCEGAQ